VGGTGSGKTTLLNDLLAFTSEDERIIALEDTAEIHPIHAHFLSLLSRSANADGFGAVSLRDLLKQTLRMRPDRIVIGECRGDEVLDLLQALNTGHQGTLSTLHANSARDGLKRLELLALIGARGTIPSPLIKELISNGVQKIAFLKRRNGVRKIESVLAVHGMEREVILTKELCIPIFAGAL
jgi:pilus assembly protein CpaF